MKIARRSILAPPSPWRSPSGLPGCRAPNPNPGGRRATSCWSRPTALRWQEVFRGAEASLLNKQDGGVADVESLRREFWRGHPRARREALLPFLWTTVARQGQLFGNAIGGAWPGRQWQELLLSGYNEMLTAHPTLGSTARQTSQPQRQRPGVAQPQAGLPRQGRRVCSWDVFPYILNVQRSGLPVNAGWVPWPVSRSPRASSS